MKIALQILLLVFAALYFFASINQRSPDRQRFFVIAAISVCIMEAVTIAVL